MSESTKKTVKCPACGFKWHVDIRGIKSRTIICPDCKRVDFVEYFTGEDSVKEKKGYKSEHPVFQRKTPVKSQDSGSHQSSELYHSPVPKKKSESQQESFSLTSDCFIVTATYGTSSFEKLAVFYRFRDDFLLRCFWGRLFTVFYYRVSPFFACFLRKSRILRRLSVFFLDRLADLIEGKLR
jgi:endogenous inhibitor of DNA gyrase (YacG/DUF329 family)